MKKLKLYLDICCFNRPYDDQGLIKVKIETDAKLYIQAKIKDGTFSLIWSYMLDYENEFNPFQSKRNLISKWENFCSMYIKEDNEIFTIIDNLEKKGIHGKDAVHIACSLFSQADYFITTDYKLIKKCSKLNNIKVVNPIDFLTTL